MYNYTCVREGERMHANMSSAIKYNNDGRWCNRWYLL